MARGLYLHGYEDGEPGASCDACERTARRRYRVSYTGEAATHTLCSHCWYAARMRFGSFRDARQPPEEPGP